MLPVAAALPAPAAAAVAAAVSAADPPEAPLPDDDDVELDEDEAPLPAAACDKRLAELPTIWRAPMRLGREFEFEAGAKKLAKGDEAAAETTLDAKLSGPEPPLDWPADEPAGRVCT